MARVACERRVRHRLWSCAVVTVIILAGPSCGGQTPTAPDLVQPPPSSAAACQASPGFVTISGWVYATTASGEPPIRDARIDVIAADGSRQTTLAAADGSYRVSVPCGDVTITASKVGYESTTWRISVWQDTILNFGLEPA